MSWLGSSAAGVASAAKVAAVAALVSGTAAVTSAVSSSPPAPSHDHGLLTASASTPAGATAGAPRRPSAHNRAPPGTAARRRTRHREATAVSWPRRRRLKGELSGGDSTRGSSGRLRHRSVGSSFRARPERPRTALRGNPGAGARQRIDRESGSPQTESRKDAGRNQTRRSKAQSRRRSQAQRRSQTQETGRSKSQTGSETEERSRSETQARRRSRAQRRSQTQEGRSEARRSRSRRTGDARRLTPRRAQEGALLSMAVEHAASPRTRRVRERAWRDGRATVAVSSGEALGISKPGSGTGRRSGSDDRLVARLRRGDERAFEVLYERHRRQLLAYCRQMLGSTQDAEDALQATFTSAHRALMADDRDIDVRPWLYTIARNACQNILRRRRRHPSEPIPEVCAAHGDPVDRAEQREEVGQLLEAVAELPELQRSAIVLAELHGLRHREIGTILGITPEQVKSQVFQARTNLISEREARTADCREIQGELAQASGAALMRRRLRRHLRTCADCRAAAKELGRSRRLGLFAPLAPVFDRWRSALGIRWRASTAAVARAPQDLGMTGGAVELGGGGMAALAVKVLAGLACLGAGTRVATLATGLAPPERSPTVSAAARRPAEHSRIRAGALTGPSRHASVTVSPQRSLPRSGGEAAQGRTAPSAVSLQLARPHLASPHVGPAASSTRLGAAGSPPLSLGGGGGGEHAHGKSEEAPGRSGEAPGKSGEAPGRSGEAPGKSGEAPGRSGQAPGKSGEAPDRSGEAPGRSGEAPGRSSEAPGSTGEAGRSGEAHPAGAEAASPGHSGSASPASSRPPVRPSGSHGGAAAAPPAEK